ncbi:hypothetical protein ASPVEDRAFT_43266 [Aspergillus versicolor CBS 583.65]|uniref:Uncharacterized protein n=1 Tax=Aspergillus versicolor CBS 583.65 TaxID=1036611 RepID=A0A1L9PQG9_ASPVE|nr:uncharacterized protein ASPVEDRAFT_43266 [Aspergillus versicolor CBS 583.65]OJJ03760.1 hypothetical protein ASPVEDRAFT_43266 [Aspergillus versicolor CBS 583.65]
MDQSTSNRDLVSDSRYRSPHKRKHGNSLATPVKNTRAKPTPKSGKKTKNAAGLTDDAPPVISPSKGKSSRVKKTSTASTEERRLRRFRSAPPKSYRERLDRAISQRMFVVGQTVTGTDENPDLGFDIVGSTGNIYKTVIRKEPTCSCPDARNGNQCKHICYVLAKVLKAPAELQYQLAFLSSEIREIYDNSPLRNVKDKVEDHETDGNRKPVEGECPICFMEFNPSEEEIVWCRAACGNNIHKTCFQQWAATQNAQGVRCVYCRSPWENQEIDCKPDMSLEQLVGEGQVGEDGYVNVARQVGLSGERGTKPSLLFKLSSALGAPALILFCLA